MSTTSTLKQGLLVGVSCLIVERQIRHTDSGTCRETVTALSRQTRAVEHLVAVVCPAGTSVMPPTRDRSSYVQRACPVIKRILVALPS